MQVQLRRGTEQRRPDEAKINFKKVDDSEDLPGSALHIPSAKMSYPQTLESETNDFEYIENDDSEFLDVQPSIPQQLQQQKSINIPQNSPQR